MSLDVYLHAVRWTEIFEANITHNLGSMAKEAGIYTALWRPEEGGYTHAGQIVGILKNGLAKMKANPTLFRALEPENKWGTYDDFVPWIENYLAACEQNPDAEITVSR